MICKTKGHPTVTTVEWPFKMISNLQLWFISEKDIQSFRMFFPL